ncbi:MAG: SPOR domain-containing protein [Bacteroidota bacterium]
MKQNNILTYLLYLLLAGLIVAAGYKACQIKKDKQLEKEKQEAELQKALHDMGYSSADSTAASGSTYSDKTEPTTVSTTTDKTSTATNSGIEDEQDKTPAQSTAPASKNTAAAKTATPANKTTPAAKSLTASKAPAKSSTSAPKAPTKGVTASKKGAKFRVQAGSFTKMDGARHRLEEVIKAGYPNAEIGKTNNGKFAVVIVYRTNDKAEAIKVADKLEAKGIDATVMANDK